MFAGHHPAYQPFSRVARIGGTPAGSISTDAMPGPARPITDHPCDLQVAAADGPDLGFRELGRSDWCQLLDAVIHPTAACADDLSGRSDLQRIARASALADHAHHGDRSATNVDDRRDASGPTVHVGSTRALDRAPNGGLENERLPLPRAHELLHGRRGLPHGE